MDLKGSKTEANLMTAFSGECMARVKYEFYAEKVRTAGYEEYGNVIDEISGNEKEHAEIEIPSVDPTLPHIIGDTEVYPYDTKVYTINGITGGSWSLNSKKAKIVSQTEESATVEVITGRSGEFELKYIKENDEIVLNITIKSL